jgi:hypothetical protein
MPTEKRVVKYGSKPKNKHILSVQNPDVFNSNFPVWRFSELDFDGKWGWNYLGSLVRFVLNQEVEEILINNNEEVVLDAFIKMSDKYYTYDKFIAHLSRNSKNNTTLELLFSLLKHLKKDYFKIKIIDKLSQFENSTWENIKRESFGKKGKTKHHFQDTGSIDKVAQKRLIELNLDDANLFTFRLEGSMRVWGTLDRGVFSLLWFDPYHEIYPSNKKDNNTKIIK